MSAVTVRVMRPDEVSLVAALVGRVFDDHVAPLFASDGVAEFHRYAAAEALARRQAADHLVLVAEDAAGRLVGAAEIRAARHLSMFFVDTRAQRQGVGRALLAEVVRRCRARRPDLTMLTVHASPNAVPAYQRLGFCVQEPEREQNGIRFTTMSLTLPGTSSRLSMCPRAD